MNNIFFASPSDFNADDTVEIKNQEATHISKVLRHKVGDIILVADGEGARFEVEILEITKKSVLGKKLTTACEAFPSKKKILAFGIIKKRDRLEFAIEKAVELGAWEIVLFNADHSERNRINSERLETQIISAFKQSGRFWLPKLAILDSLDEVYDQYGGGNFLMAHVEAERSEHPIELETGNNVMMIGPEGGFSSREKEIHRSKGGELVSLGPNRLRAETAVVTFLSQYLFSE